ncbi:MAG: hypothetical protein JSW27_10285, partial [Phycisphaerales bacterium]
MKRIAVLAMLVGLALATSTSATMVHQDWNTGVAGSRDAIIEFLVDLVDPVPPVDEEEIIDTSDFVGSKDNYVAKFYGWVTVPETGTYQFHYSCDDYGMLYVSQDEEMANAVEVSYVDGWCAVDQWNKYDTQHSAPMELVAGQVMAVMAFFQEAGGGDNMDIGWTGPGLSSDITDPTYLTDYITHIPPTPTKAKNPSPENGAVDVPRDTDMSWTAGKFAVTHDVYLGTSADDVNAASRADDMGVLVSQGQTPTTYDPGILEYGQTYYWRIDEVNANPSTIFTGKLWEFTVEPFAYPIEGIVATANTISDAGAGIENAINGSGLSADGTHSVEALDMWLGIPNPGETPQIEFEFPQVYKLYQMVVWNYNVQFELMLGFGCKDVTVEYSADGVDWTVLGDVQFAQATARADYTANTMVDFGGAAVKYVRLTINSGWGPLGQFGLSEIQFMQIPAHAREPQPADAAADVEVGATLSWRAGREAVSHEVYLSADPNALALAGTTDDASFTPPGLEFGMDYYWQVVEVNEADEIPAWAGAVWGFQTQDYALIDGFESYDDDDNRIYDTWLDGWVNDTGSTVGYLEAPFAEQTIVNSGSQSMPLGYDNSIAPMYSEAEYDLGGMNLAGNGADRLQLFVSGLAPGFVENADGTILMNAIGTDIWGTGDQFRYAYKSLSGNGSLVARVDDLDVTPDVWCKAGVMIRQGTGTGSQHSFMPITGSGGGGASWQGRVEEGLASVNQDNSGDPVAAPYWVRIDRSGNSFSGFISPDGETWTQIGDPREVVMTDPVLIGLALTSHNANQATSAQFSNVSFTGNVTGAWEVAEIGVAQPAGNTPESVYVALEDANGSVAVVTHPDGLLSARSGWTE